MPRTSYTSDISDVEWRLLAPLLPPAATHGRPRKWPMRRVLDGIFYVLRTGCPWRMLPREYPPWPTVYAYLRRWRIAGAWEQVNAHLLEALRARDGRHAAKKLAGRKRHILVDTGGLLMRVVVHAADVADRDGARLVLDGITAHHPRLKRVWADQPYRLLPRGGASAWSRDAEGVTRDVVYPPWRQLERYGLTEGEPPRGFRVTPRRWAVEQAHQQLKEELGLDHFEGRSDTPLAWVGLHRHALLAMLTFTFLRHLRLRDAHVRRGRGENPPHAARRATRAGRVPRRRGAPVPRVPRVARGVPRRRVGAVRVA